MKERPPLSVAFVGSRGIPASAGGVERYVDAVATRLVERGHRVTVYCRSHYTGARGQHRGVRLEHLPCLNTKHLEAISHTLLATLSALRHGDQIVHFQALGPSLLAWIPRLAGRKVLVTVQGLDWQRRKWGPLARRVLRLGEWCSAHFPHATVVVSQELERRYRSLYAGVRVVHLPNGSDFELPAVEPGEEDGRDGGEGGGPAPLLCVSRLVPEKGLELLVEAYRRSAIERPLHIAGGVAHSEDFVRRLRTTIGAESKADIRLLGELTHVELGRALQRAYLVVSASEIEGLPIALIEAMRAGACVLASDIAPHRELLARDELLVPAGDVDAMASALRRFDAAPRRVEELGAELAGRAHRLYDWQAIVDSTEALYRELVDGD